MLGRALRSVSTAASELIPPMPVSQEPMRIKGQVKQETTVLVWSTPGGYCGDDVLANVSANLLTNYIYQTIVPSWDWSNDEQSINSMGCFAKPFGVRGVGVLLHRAIQQVQLHAGAPR